MNDCKRALMSYGLDLMAQATQGDALALRQQLGGPWPEHDWSSYEKELIGGRDLSPPQPGERLLSIFSRVRLPEAEAEPPLAYYRPHLLELDGEALFPADKSKLADPNREVTWDGFAKAMTRVIELGREDEALRLCSGQALFETFYHLMYRHAWALPCTYGEEGVSLFEQWKVVAALTFATGEKWADGPGDKFTLIGGDIPGIQDFLYTITSKGAAKGLRGRSFFLQLLGDAVVRRLVTDLELCPANVVYAAGGNFTLLTPAGSEAVLGEWQADFNRTLLDEFEGDLYLALAWESLPKSAVGTPEFAEVRERLGVKVAAAKSRCFAEVVERDGWAALFQPQGRGGLDYCQVCQREPRPGENLVEETTEAGETVQKCERCHSFETLARDIAYDSLWMTVIQESAATREERGWRGTLTRLTGFSYRFEHNPPHENTPGTVYTLNATNLEGTGARGFRFVANVTPRIGEADREWVREHYPDLEVPPSERIKDFALMALQSKGIARVGVLRMDVDNLSAIFAQYLRGSMAQISALSAALDLFFVGHLNRVCRDVASQGKHGNTLYIIYAGGDDLFVVGAWDRMPLLAERIRTDLIKYAGKNPYLTLSGGVTLERRKFPLYRAAERAQDALEDGAKAHIRPDGGRKNAITFLGQTLAWEDFAPLEEDRFGVKESTRRLVRLLDKGVPRSLLQIVQGIYGQYLRDLKRNLKSRSTYEQHEQLYYGRWMWLQAYQLKRLVERHEEAKADIEQLQRDLMHWEKVRHSGLAARWAEYLTRKER